MPTFVYTYAFLIAFTHVHHSKQAHICMYLEDSNIFDTELQQTTADTAMTFDIYKRRYTIMVSNR